MASVLEYSVSIGLQFCWRFGHTK